MAKSPTPIPTPPVKIQRGQRKPGAPVKRRRKKKVNPVVLFLHGLVRRLYFGLKTGFKFLLLVPVLGLPGAWIAMAVELCVRGLLMLYRHRTTKYYGV